jgi:outer membrane immunogenic protein
MERKMGLRTILTGVRVSLSAPTAADAADMRGLAGREVKKRGFSMLKFGSLTALALVLPLSGAYADGSAPRAYNWVGLYVGGTLGYGLGSSVTDYNNTQGQTQPDGNHPWTHNDPSGFLGGVTAGYNYRVGDRWIAGAEADISMADISGKDNMVWADGHHWHTGWGSLATLRGRVGWEYDPVTLIYGTAGLAIMHSSEYNIGDNADQSSDNSGWKAGWVAGFGAERAFGDRWTGKVEYLHAGFPDNVGYGENGGGYIYKNSLDLVRVGANYKLN